MHGIKERFPAALLMAMCCAAAAAPLAAQDRLAQPIVVPVPERGEYQHTADLPYLERDGRTLLMDVFTPLGVPGEGAPAVIFVHGGPLPPSVAPQGKDLGQYQSLGPFVTAAGLAGVVFSHGFSGLDAFQSARRDVEAAIHYVRDHAMELGVDPDRICTVHASAGGSFLAPLLEDRPPWLKCVVLYYPVLRPEVMEELGVGEVPARQRAGLDPFPRVAPPAEGAPALFIAEAGEDAPPVNADLRRLRDAAVRAGWTVEYWNHPSGPHGFDVFDPSRRSRLILERTRRFLEERLSEGGRIREQVPDVRQHRVHSSVVGEDYLIQVGLPEGYAESDQRYPALYVLDAEKSFGLVRDVVDWLSWAEEIPPVIVVGISYGEDTGSWWSKRSRDLTPTADTVGPYGRWPRSGGANRFREFMSSELFPLVEETYRAGDVRGLVGLSFGGLFGFYDLLKPDPLFDRLVLVSPALAWDEELIARLEEQRGSRSDSLFARVHSAVGGADAANIIEPWRRLDAALRARAYHGFDYSSELLEGETHISAFPIGLTHGLKATFGGREGT